MFEKFFEWYAAKSIPRFKIFRDAKELYETFLKTQYVSFHKRTKLMREIAAQDLNLKEAEAKYREAIRLSGEANDVKDIATARYQLGMLFHLQGRFDEAHNELNCCLETLASLPQLNRGDRGTLSGCYYHLGIIEMLQGNKETARKQLMTARSIDEGIGDLQGIAIDEDVLQYMDSQYD